jgi:hypothetical protein
MGGLKWLSSGDLTNGPNAVHCDLMRAIKIYIYNIHIPSAFIMFIGKSPLGKLVTLQAKGYRPNESRQNCFPDASRHRA